MYIVVFLNSEFRKNNPKCAQTIVRRVCCEGHCITLFGEFNQNLSFHTVHHFQFASSKTKTGMPGVIELLIAAPEDSIFSKIFGQRHEAGNAVSNFETVDFSRFCYNSYKNSLVKGSICFFVLQNCLNFGFQHYLE